MPRKPDTPCADCGTLLWSSATSLAAGARRCQPCRRANSVRIEFHKTCACCKTEFIATSKDKKTCSEACAQHQRQAGRIPSPKTLIGRTCQVCSATYRATYPDQRTCSRACGMALRRRSVVALECVDCGQGFTGNGTFGRKRRSCGSACPALPGRRLPRSCATCGSTFDGHGRGKYCAKPCAVKAAQCAAQKRRPVGPTHTKTCLRCGSSFTTSKPLKAYCKLACHKHAARKRQKRKRRALHLGVAHEQYTTLEIAKRDRYMCGLCRKRVAMTKQVPHPKAPTIDHVVPLDDGGDDVRANVQLAHFICNSTKGVRGTQQLALIG